MEKETMSKSNMDVVPGSSSKHPQGQASEGYHQRSESLDSGTGHHYQHNQYHHFPKSGQLAVQPPPHQQHHQHGHSKSGYAYPPPHHHSGYHHPHYPPPPRSSHPMVRSVVTHSFSMEEEREDGPSRYSVGHRLDPGYTRDEYRSPSGDLNDRSAPHGIQPVDHRVDNIHQQASHHHHAFDPPPPVPPFNSERVKVASHYGNRDLPPVPEEDDSRLPPHDMRRAGGHSPSVRIPPSPREELLAPPSVQRSHSAGAPLPPGSFRIGGGHVAGVTGGHLKRNFWHHSRPVTAAEDFDGSLPQEFMPPKRTKVTGQGGAPSSRGRRDYVVTARSYSSDPTYDELNGLGPSSGGSMQSPSGGPWYNRAMSMSWEARDENYRRDPRTAPSWSSRSPTAARDGPMGGNAPHWTEAPYMPSPRSRYSSDPASGNSFEIPPHQTWGSPRDGVGGGWSHHSTVPEGFHHSQSSVGGSNWGHPNSQNRDEHDSKHAAVRGGQEREGYNGIGAEMVGHHGSNFESVGMDGDHHGSLHFTIRGMDSMGAPSSKGPPPDMKNSGGAMDDNLHQLQTGPVKLLALPEDRISLSETLCLVRENIEVFTATVEDVEAPAPGRKHAVSVGQVGLRCIHCRHTTRSSERVKRAVCYPSSIKRIYRTVIDMKLDHFLHCKFVPQNLKDTLAALKANNTRSTGTTMQYFIRAATTLGMVDGPSGVRIDDNSSSSANVISPAAGTPLHTIASPTTGTPQLMTPGSSDSGAGSAEKLLIESQNSGDKSNQSDASIGATDFRIHRSSSMSSEGSNTSVVMDDASVPTELFTGKVPLALPEDKMSLSPLRCFLREQVCAFSATDEDIAVRTPTTFAVSVGQVGIGCVHCMSQPAKMRLNRAVCFPFSIARIYQSVADIQRFHLSECKMVPTNVKEKFMELQSQSSKGSKGLATRQYWVTSAKKIGLVDTAQGIRFGRDPAVPEQKSVSLDILAQVASNVTTVNRPLVIPEDKPYIAEFLYVVMEQLLPCRFTEADRNKRRLKDVGCIGVECKHCAGQVDSRKFFWSSVNAVESNFVSVHTHMVECRMVPDELKDRIGELKKLRKEQTAALKTGSQKSFFARVWKRLHGDAEQQQRELDKQAREASKAEHEEGKSEADQGKGVGYYDEKMLSLKEAKTAQEHESFNGPEISFSQDLPDSPMQMTPAASPASVAKPMAEINVETSPASPDASENIKDVSDQMAIVTV